MQASKQWKMMGTFIDLWIDSDLDCEKIFINITDELLALNQCFSANQETSELMQLNHLAGVCPVAVSPALFSLISIGKQHSLAQPSHLNIAIGPLVKLWRIGFKQAKLPTPTEIFATLPLLNSEQIILDSQQQTVFLARKGMEIDLGALAKGYIADYLMAKLKKQCHSAMINLGGNFLAFGPNPKRENGKWYVGIQHPQKRRHQHLGILAIENQSVVTSGIYERFLMVDGKRYHHLLDSQTGFPFETRMASLTIVANQSLTCEIWTSRLFGLPISEALAVIEQHPELEGIIVDQENQVYLSSGLKSFYYPNR